MYAGFKPSQRKRAKKANRHVKRDEVVLFDNIKQYDHRPGKSDINRINLGVPLVLRSTVNPLNIAVRQSKARAKEIF